MAGQARENSPLSVAVADVAGGVALALEGGSGSYALSALLAQDEKVALAAIRVLGADVLAPYALAAMSGAGAGAVAPSAGAAADGDLVRRALAAYPPGADASDVSRWSYQGLAEASAAYTPGGVGGGAAEGGGAAGGAPEPGAAAGDAGVGSTARGAGVPGGSGGDVAELGGAASGSAGGAGEAGAVGGTAGPGAAVGSVTGGRGAEPGTGGWVGGDPWARLAHRAAQLAALSLPGLAPGLAAGLAARTDDLARGFVRAVRRRDWAQAAGVARWLVRAPDVPESLGLAAGLVFVRRMSAGDPRVALHIAAAQRFGADRAGGAGRADRAARAGGPGAQAV